jgi:D-galactarolactone cycloisomerase
MERRKFLEISFAGAVTGLLGNNIAGESILRKSDDLAYHTITGIKFTSVKLKYPRQVGKNSQLDIHGWGPESGIHILFTDKGASGWGMNRGSQKNLEDKFELIKGKRVSDLLIPETGVISPDFEGFDFSLYDLAGKILDKPVYRLLGSRRPEPQLCYSGMIYFDDL